MAQAPAIGCVEVYRSALFVNAEYFDFLDRIDMLDGIYHHSWMEQAFKTLWMAIAAMQLLSTLPKVWPGFLFMLGTVMFDVRKGMWVWWTAVKCCSGSCKLISTPSFGFVPLQCLPRQPGFEVTCFFQLKFFTTYDQVPPPVHDSNPGAGLETLCL